MWQPQGLYAQFLLRTPALLYGSGSVRGLYNYPGERIAVIHGSSASDEDKELIAQTFKKKSVRFFERSWKGEPELSGLADTLGELEKYRPDVFIAFGGGSVIDGAKLCRLFYEFPYIEIAAQRIDGSDLKTKFIAIPTTIGSGAEVSSAAVYWDEANHRKDMAVLHELQPDVVVYDENYVKNTPKSVLYASALDGMSHIIEGYVSSVENEAAEMLGEKGLGLFKQALENEEAVDFAALQLAGFIGGIVQNHCIVGAAHAIAHQLTEYGYSHGEAVGLLLTAVISANREDDACEKRYEHLARQAGFDGRQDMTAFIENLLEKGNMKEKSAKLKEILSERRAELLPNIQNDRGGKGNPLPLTAEFVEKIIRSL